MTTRTAADQAHVSASTYQRWEQGVFEHLPGLATLHDLAELFDVTTEEPAAAFEWTRRGE